MDPKFLPIRPITRCIVVVLWDGLSYDRGLFSLVIYH